jgi:polysaccharide chain length determinant protein (PEP-CTERM system associated)
MMYDEGYQQPHRFDRDVRDHFFSFVARISQRRRTAVLLTGVFCVLCWLVVAAIPDRFTSQARFYVDTTSLLDPLLKGLALNAGDRTRDEHVTIMQRTLTSRSNLARVAEMTEMIVDSDTDFSRQQTILDLESDISVKAQGPNLFIVEYSNPVPALSRDVINALLTLFVESASRDRRGDFASAQTFIETQIRDYEAQLKIAEKKLADFKIEKIDYLPGSVVGFSNRLEQARENLRLLKMRYEGVIAKQRQLTASLSSTPRFLALDSPMSMNVREGSPRQQRIETLQRRLDELSVSYTSRHPEIVQTRKALEDLLTGRDQATATAVGIEVMDGEKAHVPNDLYNQISMLLVENQSERSTLELQLQEAEYVYQDLQKKAVEAPRIEADFVNLNRDYEVLKSNYDGLLQRRESARISRAAESQSTPLEFRLIAAPEIPLRADPPGRTMLNIFAAFAGIVLGLGATILLSHMNGAILTANDLEDFGNISVLGSVSTVTTPELRQTQVRETMALGLSASALAAILVGVLIFNPKLTTIAQQLNGLLL